MRYVYCRICHSIMTATTDWFSCRCEVTLARILKDNKSVQLFGPGKVMVPQQPIDEHSKEITFTFLSESNPKVQRVKIRPII